MIHTVSANPSSDLGNNGDYALNPETLAEWKKADGVWTNRRRIVDADDVPVADVDTDGTLAGNSDEQVASQKAVKTYADTKESAANKSTNLTTDVASDTKYPTCKAVADYIDSLLNP